MRSKIFQATLLASLAYAAVLPRDATAAQQLLTIAPTSGTCSGSPFADECATNEQAAPFLIDAMVKYDISTPSEIAAVLSVVAFESGDFKYNINHFPGRPGQGTRAMLMPAFVREYAQSIPELAPTLSAIASGGSDGLNAIRALVLPDQYSFGSAAWFLTSHCRDVRPALQAGGQAGFEKYMECLGVTATPERLAYWHRAVACF